MDTSMYFLTHFNREINKAVIYRLFFLPGTKDF
jgi:hypothetical protein